MNEEQHVVCINDDFNNAVYRHYTDLPEEGKQYVLRALRPGIGYDLKPDISVLLVGVNNPKSEKAPFQERGFSIKRFRPIDEVPKAEKELQSVGQFHVTTGTTG